MSKLKKPKIKKEFKPKPWLKKPSEEKKVMVYAYVKAKHKEIAEDTIKHLLTILKN